MVKNTVHFYGIIILTFIITGAVAVTNGGFRQETLPLPPLLTVNCDQSESTLSECVFSNAVDMCTNRGVGVVCQGEQEIEPVINLIYYL